MVAVLFHTLLLTESLFRANKNYLVAKVAALFWHKKSQNRIKSGGLKKMDDSKST